jgi:hypothetical protein
VLPGLVFCSSETVTMLAKILTKDIGYISISFFWAWIWIGYNISFVVFKGRRAGYYILGKWADWAGTH